MRKFVLFLVLGFSLLTLSSSTHKFYVSVTNVEFNQEAQSLQIISKIFIDDLEDVLQARYNSDLSLDSTNKDEQVDGFIEAYLKKKINIRVNNQEVAFDYLGKEYDIDALDFYLEVPNVKSVNSITISNEVLFELFPDQQNIIHIKTPKGRRSLILTRDKDNGMLKFN